MSKKNVEVVKVRAGGRGSSQMEVNYTIGSTLEELSAQYGDVMVAAKAREKIIVNLQDYLRGKAKKGVSTEELQGLAKKWVPGMRAAGTSKAEKASSLIAALSEEDRAAFIKQLTEKPS